VAETPFSKICRPFCGAFQVSSDVAIPTTAPTSQLRRFFAVAVNFCYLGILIAIWGCVPILLLISVADRPNIVWITLALSFLVYIVCLFIIPKSYYDLRPFEMDGRVYRRLGVRKFRYIVGDGDGVQWLVKRIDPGWQCALTKLSNEKWIERTCVTECIKLALIVFTLPIVAIAYYGGHTILASLLLLLNIPYQIYPILLQRYTRAKLLRIGELRNKRSTSEKELVSASTA
jgi:hypothetical protein